VFSFSKSFGMAAWRVGYVHARARWAEQISRAHWGATMSTATASQLGALAALRVSEGYLAEQRAFLRTNRDLAVSRLCGCGLACPSPPAGFFAWADIEPYGLDSDEFADRCAAEAGVLISAGSAFGSSGRGRVRINFAVPGDRLAAALDRLSAWVGTRLAPAAAR
jgi:aspartate/methionine/tyrosine aminotransferase